MKRLGWLVLMIAPLYTEGYLRGQEPLSVVLFDSVGLDSGEVEEAVVLSRRFFENMGLKSAWTLCRSLQSCSLPPEGTYVRVSLVAWTKGRILGFANMAAAAAGSPQVYVFHPRVQGLAARTNLPLGRVIACVMVHEMLHSFGLEHSPHGIMRATLRSGDLRSFGQGPALGPIECAQLRKGASQLQRVSRSEAK